MSDNINVAVRVRPLIQREQTSGQKISWLVRDNTVTQLENDKQVGTSYVFDHVFDQHETNMDIYDQVAMGIVEESMKGFNGTIFAYGQTSSGKTHTMMGDKLNQGIIPLAMNAIFEGIEGTPEREYLLRVSYLEIYNEQLCDLLSDEKKKLKIHQDTENQVYVANLTEEMVTNADQILQLMKKGADRRKIGETNMNERSSRSHTIFRMIIESRERQDDSRKSVDGAVMVSHLNLVDLAGSERVSQTGATGVRFQEGCAINSSLFQLSQVIYNLSEGKSFIGFRDSKLTRILQNSLGGNSKTAIICTVTPASVEETHSTLKFASRAKNIKNKPQVNEVVSEAALLKRYKTELDNLKKKIEMMGNTEVQLENEELQRRLEEKEQLQKEQQDKIDILQKMVCVSSRTTDGDTAPKKRKLRRETWCPGKITSRKSVGSFSGLSPLRNISFSSISPLMEIPEPKKKQELENSFVDFPNDMQVTEEKEEIRKTCDCQTDFLRDQLEEVMTLCEQLQTEKARKDEQLDSISQAVCTLEAHNMELEDTIKQLRGDLRDKDSELRELQEFTKMEAEIRENSTSPKHEQVDQLKHKIRQLEQLVKVTELNSQELEDNGKYKNEIEELKQKLVAKENELQQAYEQHETLKISSSDDMVKLEIKIVELETSLEHNNSELQTLQEQYDVLKAAKSQDTDNMDDGKYQNEVEELKQLLEAKQNELQQAYEQHETLKTSSSDDVDKLQIKNGELEECLERSNAELQTLQEQYNVLKAKSQDTDDVDIGLYQNEIEELKQLLVAKENELQKTYEQHETLKISSSDDVDRLKMKIEELEACLESNNSELQTLQEQYDVLKAKSQDTDNMDDGKYQNEVEELQQLLEAKQNELQQAYEQHETLKTSSSDDVNKLQIKIEELEACLESNNSELQTLQEQYDVLKAISQDTEDMNIGNYQNEMEELKQVLLAKENELQQAYEQQETLKTSSCDDMNKLQIKIEELETSLEHNNSELQTLQEQYDVLKVKSQDNEDMFQKEMEELKNQVDSKTSELKQVQEQCEALQAEDRSPGVNKERLLSEENWNLAQQRRIEEMDKARKESLAVLAQTRKENEELITKLNQKVYELECSLQKSTTESEVVNHKLKKSLEETQSLKIQVRDLEELHAQHNAAQFNRRQELDPAKLQQRIKQLEFNLDLTNQRSQKFDTENKTLKDALKKSEDLELKYRDYMRQAREFQHLLGQEKEQSSLLLRKFNAAAAELSDLRWNNAELREKVKQVPKLEEDVANLKAKVENLQRDLLEKGKESTGVIHLEEQKASLLASLEKSKSTVAELQEDIRKLNEDLTSKVDENSDLTAQLEELQKTVNSAKDKEVNFQSVVDKLRNQLSEKQETVDLLESQMCEKQLELDEVKHLEEQKASVLASLEKLKLTVAELQENITKLKEDLTSKVDENSDLAAQLEELQKTINSAKDKEVNFQSVVDKLRNQLSEKQETVDLLESQMCEKQQELDEVSHREEQTTSLLASLEKSKLTVAELQENISKLKEDLISKVDENSDLTAQLEELQKTVSFAKDKEVNFQSVVDKLRNQLSEKQETVDLLESQMCEKQQALDEVNHLEEQKTNLLDSLEKLKLTVAELQEEITKLKEDLTSKVDENSDLTAQLEELQKTINSAKDKEFNFQSVVEKLRNQLSEKQETVDLLESQMCEKQLELDEVNHLEEQKTNLLDSLEKSKLTVAELQEEITKLKEDLTSKVDENSDLTAQLEELQKTINSAKDKEVNFQSVVNKLRNQLSEKQETVDLLESQMCEKQQELDKVKEGQVGVVQQQSDVQQQLQAMEKEKTAAANRAENLETTMESLRLQLEEKTSQIHGLEELITTLQSTIDELEAKLADKEKRADEVFVLEEQTANLQSTVEELEAKLAEKQKEVDEVLNLEGQTTSLVDELRSQLCDKDKQIDQVSSERDLLSEELREIKDVFAELQEEMQNKEDEFLDTKEKGMQHIDALNSELTEARTRLEKLSEELDATKALLEDKQTSLKQEEERSELKNGYEKQVAELNTEIEKLHQKMQDTTNNFLEQIRHMEKCCDEADNELKQEKIEHEETKRKLEEIQAGQNEEGDASEDGDKPKGKDKALVAAKKKIQSLEKALQEGLEHIKLLQEARDHTSQQVEIRHLQQCCMEADAELEQEKEEHEKTKQKLLQLEENIKMKKPEEKSLEELKQELGAKNMEIVQLKRDLLMEIDPLKKKLKSLKGDNDYLQNKVSEYRNELRKAREEQAEVTVSQFGSQPCKTCAQRTSGSSSGIISRVAYFTVETENKRLKEQVTGLEGQVKELTLYKSEFKRKIELLKRELSYYKGKTGIAPALDEAPKVPLKGVTNSPRASPARPAPVTAGSSTDQKSSENYNWLAGGVDWDKNEVKADEQPSECTTQ